MSRRDKNSDNRIEENVRETSKDESVESDDRGEEIEVEVKKSTSNDTEPQQVKEPSLEEQIEVLRHALDDKNDQYLRLAAEFDNYKKRTNREFTNLIESANKELIRSLLEIVDNFKRALSESNSKSDQGSLLKGMDLIYTQFDKLLIENGLDEIEAEGQPFDPELHEAVMTMESDDIPEDYVAEELQKGYRLKGKVIRHSKVSVAKPKK